MASSGGTGGATGGTFMTGTGGTTGGTFMAGRGGGTRIEGCRRVAEDYVARTEAECLSVSFRCPAALAIFVDDCGCGCDRTPFEDPSEEGTIYPVVSEL